MTASVEARDIPASPPFDLHGKRVWVAGDSGMAGSALVRRLAREDCTLITASHAEIDLTRQQATEAFVARARPDVVFVAAARVGGIVANMQRPLTFLYDNLMIAANVVETSRRAGVERLMFLSSSCVYPRDAPQPLKESYLLSGSLEPTNEYYAVAKIAGMKFAEACSREEGRGFISVLPTNLYGPNDNYDPEMSHVLPGLLRKIHLAMEERAPRVEIWGSGRPLREFLHVDDFADACLCLLRHYHKPQPVNVGSGEEISIADLARLVAEVVGFRGDFVFDTSRPDGTPRKRLDTRVLDQLGWMPSISLADGIRAVYQDMMSQHIVGDRRRAAV